MNIQASNHNGQGFYLQQIKNTDLAIFSYYIQSNGQAVVIDPIIDTKPLTSLIKSRGTKLSYVMMTHYHADFIAGHLQFPQTTLVMGQGCNTTQNGKYKIKQLKDNQILNVGDIKIKAIHTPGHTPQSTTFLLIDKNDQQFCIFTGDTLFLGDVGRPDLATSKGVTKVDLANQLFDSLQKLKQLNENLRIYPAHGSGSACGGKGISDGNYCTLSIQKQKNYALKIEGKNEFVSILLKNLPSPPEYYFHDAEVNRNGPSSYTELSENAKRPLNLQQFKALVPECAILDTRTKVESGILRNSFWVPSKGAITTWIPMVVKAQQNILLIVQQGKGQQIVERLLRLGYFNIKGYNNFKMEQYDGQTYQAVIESCAGVHKIQPRFHLDVRNQDQWIKTGIIQNSICIPLKQLNNRCDQLKTLRGQIVVSCRSAMRARFAQTILRNHGVLSTILDDKVQNFEKQGFKMVPYIN